MIHRNECGVVLLNSSSDRVLVVLQRSSKKWGLPKGHQEAEESAYTCAVRELYEETGVQLAQIPHKVIAEEPGNNRLYVIIKLLRPIRTTRPVDRNEILDTKWISLKSLEVYVRTYRCNATFHIITALKGKYGIHSSMTEPLTPVKKRNYDMWRRTDITGVPEAAMAAA
jgi:mRNA-decapping enzyme subunit 2